MRFKLFYRGMVWQRIEGRSEGEKWAFLFAEKCALLFTVYIYCSLSMNSFSIAKKSVSSCFQIFAIKGSGSCIFFFLKLFVLIKSILLYCSTTISQDAGSNEKVYLLFSFLFVNSKYDTWYSAYFSVPLINKFAISRKSST